MRLVILESPFAADTPEGVQANIDYARRCVRDSLMRGEAPIASHLLYTQPGILDDTIPGERHHGINAGIAWCKVAEATVAYVDHGISIGMRYGIEAARAARILVEYRRLDSILNHCPGCETRDERAAEEAREAIMRAFEKACRIWAKQ